MSVTSCASSKEVNSNLITEDVISIADFGAIPNDGKDDSQAIQAAIDKAINQSSSSIVYCPPGVYDLKQGVIIANQKKDGNFRFVTLTLTGHIAAYSANQTIGSTTTFRQHNPSFGIALQQVRNCVIENIVFEGSAKLPSRPSDILNRRISDSEHLVRTDRFSPSCAIVIDPFHKSVPNNNRYSSCTTSYRNNATGGSSMVSIKGCAFFNHYIAIANNPSASIANGDNIRLENSHVNSVHTVWSTGQTQSRANSIDNVYAIGIHTFVSGTQIGNQAGTPPSLRNINLAGFCKQLADINTGFAGFSAYQSYFESIWALGTITANFVAFNQCHIKFYHPTADIPITPLHLKSNSNVSFNDCDIAYFSNCTEQIPFVFDANHVTLSGGQIEGGLVAPGGITNAGGDQIHKVTYNDVLVKCKSNSISKNYSGRIKTSLYAKPYVGGAFINTYDGKSYRVKGDTYVVEYTENRKLQKMDASHGYFISSNVKQYQLNNNLFTSTVVKCELPGGQTASVRPMVGFIRKVNNDTVFVSGVPDCLFGKNLELYIVEYVQLVPEIRGNIRTGSSRVMNYSATSELKPGMRINCSEFPKNTFITKVTKEYIELNNPATTTTKLEYNGSLVEVAPEN